eukprot:jgi/Ulvmu1/2266/UM013_0113.1
MSKNGASSAPQTVVIKIGTSSLIREETNSPNITSLARVCEVVRNLTDKGHRVCLVSSGAVGLGCQVLRLQERPTELAKKQALAAVGQGALMRLYSDLFSTLSLTAAQVLVTAESLSSKSQYARAQSTFAELFHFGAIPIVNENDTINVQELRIGDNDTLSAQVAVLVQADWLFLLTDVDFLYTANPNIDPDAKPITEVRDIAELAVDTSTRGTQWGTGGMATKLTAARIVCAAGCKMAICNSTKLHAIEAIMHGEPLGTVFHAATAAKVTDRKRWILSVPARGRLHVDEGCATAIRAKKHVYGAGIAGVEGTFGAMDAVHIDCNGTPVARGLVNYSSEDIQRLKGKSSNAYPEDLKYSGSDQVLYRDNIALMSVPS